MKSNLKKKLLFFFKTCLFIILLPISSLFAEKIINITDIVPHQSAAGYIEYFRDDSASLSIQKILAFQHRFKSDNGRIINHGFTSSAYWIKLIVKKLDSSDLPLILEFNYPVIDSVELFLPSAEGTYKPSGISGDSHPFYFRKIKYRNPAFEIPMQHGEVKTVYLRVLTSGTMTFPILVSSHQRFYENVMSEQYLFGFYFGAFAALIIYNIFLLVSLRSLVYLYYILYVVAFGVFQLILSGLGFQYLWPGSPAWANQSNAIFSFLTIIFAIMFTREFLLSNRLAPGYDRILRLFLYLLIMLLPLSVFGNYTIAALIISVIAAPVIIICVITALAVLSHGYAPARLYLIAFSVISISGILIVLRNLGASLFMDFSPETGAYIGSAIEMVLLSLALADKINEIKREREAVYANSLESQKLAYENLKTATESQRQLDLIHQELELARSIHQTILPPSVPGIPGLSIALRYLPMEQLGGDFYDFCYKNKKTIGILIADVSGHGVPAALVASMFKVAFTSLDAKYKQPALLLHSMNTIMLKNMNKQFITASYIYIDLENYKITYANAGHPSLLIYKRKQRVIKHYRPKGKLLGMLDIPLGEEIEIPIERGDRVILYTDGISDARNAEDNVYGEERFLKFIRSHHHVSADTFAGFLVSEIKTWTGNVLQDDITLIVVDFT